MADAANLVIVGHSLERRLRRRACLLDVVAARREEAPARPVAGPRGCSGDAYESVLAGDLRDRLDEAAGVRVSGLAEEGRCCPQLGEPPAVHDGDAIRERGDHGQVVAHVHGRDPVRGAEVSHRREHVRLRRDVEPGRGLVEDDDAGAIGERHRERHALLLAAGQLVWISAQEGLVTREQHLGQRLDDACAPLCVRRAEAVGRQRLVELRLDLQRRVQRGRGVLGNVRDELASELLAL
jgi:hypothetical protein